MPEEPIIAGGWYIEWGQPSWAVWGPLEVSGSMCPDPTARSFCSALANIRLKMCDCICKSVPCQAKGTGMIIEMIVIMSYHVMLAQR